VLGDAGEHLAGGDGCVEAVGQGGVALSVVCVEWFLDPFQLEMFQDAAEALGGRPVPLLVGVDHERELVAEVFAYGLQPAQVGGGVRLANLDLYPADPASERPFGVVEQVVDGGGQEPT
jgi:hypothetical protein